MPRKILFTLACLMLVSAALAQTRIDFWQIFSDERRLGWIQERANEWNAENPDFEVVVEATGNYPETLQAAILGARQGDTPHLVLIYEIGSRLALDSGIFIPVSEVTEFDTSDYIEPVLNYYTIEGRVNSIPFNSSSPILYTNKDLMREAGLDPETPPETYGKILEACETAEAAGLEASCFGVSLNGWFFEQWMAEQGAPLANNENGREGRATEVYLDSDAFKNIANWLKEMNDRGYYTYTGRLEDWSGSDALFSNQQVMFHVTSTADLGNLGEAAQENGFEMGTGVLPIADGVERNGVVIGGASVWMVREKPQEELEAALDFLLYMTNSENMADWHQVTGYYPVRNSSVELLEEEGWFEEAPERTVAFTQLLETIPNTATAGALMGDFQEIRTIVAEAMQRIYNGADVDSTLTEARRQAEARLAEYNANF